MEQTSPSFCTALLRALCLSTLLLSYCPRPNFRGATNLARDTGTIYLYSLDLDASSDEKMNAYMALRKIRLFFFFSFSALDSLFE